MDRFSHLRILCPYSLSEEKLDYLQNVSLMCMILLKTISKNIIDYFNNYNTFFDVEALFIIEMQIKVKANESPCCLGDLKYKKNDIIKKNRFVHYNTFD